MRSKSHSIAPTDLFSRSILDDTPVPTPIEDAIANMRVIEAIVRSGANQGWEQAA